jgi:uncharacterized DUF497 family protein
VFTWDIPKSIANFEKHGVPFEEATTVFADANGLDWDDLHIPARSSGSNDLAYR